MGLGHSPRIVTDGLVLALDAQNSKSWKSGTTWTDASRNGNDVTLTGGISHSDGPFSEAGYVEFDGSTEYLSIADSADFDLGTDDFTIEGWAYLLNVSGTQSFVCKGTGTDNQASYAIQHTGTNWVYYLSGNGSTWSIASAVVMGAASANGWYHIALVRSGSTFTPYINGTAGTTTSSSTSLHNSNKSFTIGSNDIATQLITGNISNVRVVKGTALYTSDFTPPSSPLTAVTNTKLLCCQGATNVDASPSAHSFQVIIGVPTLTSVGPSTAKYFEFDGAGDRIREDTILDTFTSTSDPWSIECWFNTDVNPSVFECMIAFNYNNGNENTLLLGVRDDSGTCRIAFYYNHSNLGNYGTVTVGQWHHLAATHTTGGLKVYLDGTQIASNASTVSRSLYLCAFLIGAELDGTNVLGNYFDGKISNVKMYNKGLTAAEVEQNYNALKGRYV